MRYLLAALLLTCSAVSAQNINEQPLFGEKQYRSRGLSEADRQFVEAAVRESGSKEAAARLATQRGWKQLKQGDAEVAIQSFNQAYLLDPNNAEIYWGLGVAMTQQERHDIAVRLFARALALDPQNPRLLADIGLAHAYAAAGMTHDPVEQAKRLQGAMPWFDAAEKLDPTYATTFVNRAIALFFLGKYSESWMNVEKAEAIDRTSVDQKLLADLSKKMSRPHSVAPVIAADSTVVKTEAVTAQAEVQQSELPTTEPVVRKIVMPKIPHGIPDEPAPAPATAAQQEPVPTAEPALVAEPEVRKIVMPKIPHGIPDEPAPVAAPVQRTAQQESAPAPTVQPSAVVQAEPAPTPAMQTVSEPPAEVTPAPRSKKLRVISAEPARVKGSDKRHCLNLPTNEAIMRCVYLGK